MAALRGARGAALGLGAISLAVALAVACRAGGSSTARGSRAEAAPGQALPQSPAPRLGIGRAAEPHEIAAWDIDVGPEGLGLPPGSGRPADGRALYERRCASCHGARGEGTATAPQLVQPEAGAPAPLRRNVASHWPYAPPLFDYVRRAMPPDRPGSLTSDEVYGVVAFLLAANRIVPDTAVIEGLRGRPRGPSPIAVTKVCTAAAGAAPAHTPCRPLPHRARCAHPR